MKPPPYFFFYITAISSTGCTAKCKALSLDFKKCQFYDSNYFCFSDAKIFQRLCVKVISKTEVMQIAESAFAGGI